MQKKYLLAAAHCFPSLVFFKVLLNIPLVFSSKILKSDIKWNKLRLSWAKLSTIGNLALLKSRGAYSDRKSLSLIFPVRGLARPVHVIKNHGGCRIKIMILLQF